MHPIHATTSSQEQTHAHPTYAQYRHADRHAPPPRPYLAHCRRCIMARVWRRVRRALDRWIDWHGRPMAHARCIQDILAYVLPASITITGVARVAAIPGRNNMGMVFRGSLGVHPRRHAMTAVISAPLPHQCFHAHPFCQWQVLTFQATPVCSSAPASQLLPK